MGRNLYAAKNKSVWRIWDPIEQKFCSSGTSLYATGGRSVWLGLGGCKAALREMPKEIRDRAEFKEFTLVEVVKEN